LEAKANQVLAGGEERSEMSVAAVEEVLRRAAEDQAFREQLERDPDRALHGYDIAMWERQAIVAGDATKLEQLGVSLELSRRAAQLNREGDHLRPMEGS
jgi:hypothetical protein